MKYTESDKKRILETAENGLLRVISEFISLEKKHSGATYVGECPICKNPVGLEYNDGKHIFKCFRCNQFSGNNAVTFLMKGYNKSYPDALEYLARLFNIIIERPETRPLKKAEKTPPLKSRKLKGESPDSFCFRMLSESGLSYEDVTAKIYKSDENSTILERKTFRPGTINQKGEIIDGDDVIIEYYDLNGMPILYELKDGKGKLTGKTKEYFRVRWQYPNEHLDKNGKPFKYKSPPGSGTPIYIPERLRMLYQKGEEITRLFIQEGEKKAEKSCKHGIPSIAVSGINNLGSGGSFPEDLIRIIERCHVEEIVFLFDSDWNEISENIKITDQIDKRPRNFFYAARNYKEYMRSLKGRDIYVEIYIGHVNKTESNDKGIDDLLANTLKNRESILADDIEKAITEKSKLGKYVTLYKITSWTDHKLEELWSLNNPQKFAEAHKSVLMNLPEFKIGRHLWRFNENGQFVSAQPIESDEQFWEEVEKCRRDQTKYTDYEFRYVRSRIFLQNRGFGRFRMMDNTWSFIHLQPPFVRQIEASDARDFLFEFCEANCNEGVNEMISKGVSQYVGPDKLSLLKFIEPNFIRLKREEQYIYFDKTCWLVKESRIIESGYEQISHHIWKDQQLNYNPKYLGYPLITFDAENYNYTISPAGKNCHFLKFLENASNFTWRKENSISSGDKAEITEDELLENRQHLLSKLCAIGYMSIEYKDPNVSRAVIGMDGKQSEVGESNGRSGKSLIGELMRQVLPIAYIDGKKRDMFNDVFIWNDVTEKTKLVFIDDVLQNFQFESLFACLTGDWNVNYKGGRRITFPFDKSPKIYIATNHSIRGSGNSFADRQWLLAFSDYYNDKHKPNDDFGCLFFKEWDFEQWNLCWNLIANCIQLYLRFGVVQAPGERLEQRKLRQEITEGFISWAEEYFSSSTKRNVRISKKELQDSYYEYDPIQRKFVSPTEFKKRFIKYCEWKGYTFNPHKYDPVTGKPFSFDKDGRPIIDDKSGGVEYFMIGDDLFGKTVSENNNQLDSQNDMYDF